jgi:hypothetical protein
MPPANELTLTLSNPHARKFFAANPLEFRRWLWPEVRFYDRQRDVIESVRDNDETVVVAGHQLGKDFVTGFIALWYFCCHTPCRVVTTSVDATQLQGVLWGEMRRFMTTSLLPFDAERGGPLVVNHLHLRKVNPATGVECGISYCIGRVAAKGEGMAGHHAAYTLFVADEASGVDDESYRRSLTWSKRRLIIGNPYATNNFFQKGVEGGDLKYKPHGD